MSIKEKPFSIFFGRLFWLLIVILGAFFVIYLFDNSFNFGSAINKLKSSYTTILMIAFAGSFVSTSIDWLIKRKKHDQ